jgi:hypothetical protein
MSVLEGRKCFVDISGLGRHQENQLRIVTVQALIPTHKGNVVAIFHQIALLGKGTSILSCLQMEHYGAEINKQVALSTWWSTVDCHGWIPDSLSIPQWSTLSEVPTSY